MSGIPAGGQHGGDGAAVAKALGLDPSQLLDLSMSLNPLAPDPTPIIQRHLSAVGRYPNPTRAHESLADVMAVDPRRLLLTNGGAEAITLLAAELSGDVIEPEFALHPRHGGGPLWRSNPHNPTGLLAGADETAGVWDEAFYPLATGLWTRGDAGVPVVGSLTKLLRCPGLRIGYVLADPDLVERCRRRQPGWSVNGLVCEALPNLLEALDLGGWADGIGKLRGELVELLGRHGLTARPSDANWVLVDAPELRKQLAPHGVLVRDCESFGLPGVVRIAVPDSDGLARLDLALSALHDGRWPRPRPVVGDRTSSAERGADPGAWAMADQVQAALGEVIAARRDIRRFRADDVDDALLQVVLQAGHSAPSVGHSQPWRFLVVRDPATRGAAATMADRARLAQADRMDPASATHLRSLQLEGLREAPVGIVVCCDRRVRPAGVLGRATFADTDLWSCACAIQNMWLTARGAGLGLGWVTLFEPDELGDLLGLPDGVVTLGWLCVGWPDERPPAPGLERQGWSQRTPLDAVVLYDRWSEPGVGAPVDRSVTPGQLDTRKSRLAARDREDALLAAPGALGVLGDAILRAETLGNLNAAGTLVIAAADHPVSHLGVSAFPPTTTALVARALAEGSAHGAAAALDAGMAVRLIDCGIDGPVLDGWESHRPRDARGDLVGAAAMSRADVEALLAAGADLGAELARAGPLALGEVGIANTTIASAVASAVLSLRVDETVGRGVGSDTPTIQRKRQAIEDALSRTGFTAPRGQWRRNDVVAVLSGVGGPEQAFLVGVCLGAADNNGVIVMDGMLTGTSALLAARLRPGLEAHLIAGQCSAEPGHRAVLNALGLEAILDLRLKAGEGVGAVLALSLLRHAVRMRAATALTADSTGVTSMA